MSAYTVNMSLPNVASGPTFAIDVTAPDEDTAIDKAFDKAFYLYPQFGAFQVDGIEP